MKNYLRYLMTILALTIGVPCLSGCAQASSAIPKVINTVNDAVLWLERIDKFAQLFFSFSPNKELQVQYTKQYTDLQAALQYALSFSDAAGDVADKDLPQAFAKFQELYPPFVAFLKQIGLANTSDDGSVMKVAAYPAGAAGPPEVIELTVPRAALVGK